MIFIKVEKQLLKLRTFVTAFEIDKYGKGYSNRIIVIAINLLPNGSLLD